jgi:hypothetical protein
VNAKVQRMCVLCGIPMMVLWMVGFWAFAGFLPPPSPQMSPDALVAMFDENRTAIRIGLLITAFAATLLAPFFAVITAQIKRIEGPTSPMAYAQLALAALLVIEFIFPLFFLQAAAFRANRSPEAIQAYSDVAWLLFVGVVSTAVLQFVLIGIAALIDQREQPIFPRWFGYLTLWCAFAFSPGCLCVFFLDGPFAWRGLFCWWIPLSAFGVWFIAATVVLWGVIARQEQEEAAAPPAVSPNGAVDLDARRQVELLTAEVSALRAELVAQRSSATD